MQGSLIRRFQHVLRGTQPNFEEMFMSTRTKRFIVLSVTLIFLGLSVYTQQTSNAQGGQPVVLPIHGILVPGQTYKFYCDGMSVEASFRRALPDGWIECEWKKRAKVFFNLDNLSQIYEF